jgi:hypothetical protein
VLGMGGGLRFVNNCCALIVNDFDWGAGGACLSLKTVKPREDRNLWSACSSLLPSTPASTNAANVEVR